MTFQITVYSKSACPQCESAKMLLKSRSLPYEEIKIDDEAERLAFYAKCGPSVRQMPPALRGQLIARAEALGIDTRALIWVTHHRTDPQP